MAKQDETAPDSQDPDLSYTFIPYEDIWEKSGAHKTSGWWKDIFRDYEKLLRSTKDVYENYIESTGLDIDPLEDDYIKNIFQAKSTIIDLDLKYRLNIVEKIKSSRTARTCRTSWWNERVFKIKI